MDVKLKDYGFDEMVRRLNSSGVFVGHKATALAVAELASSARKKADQLLSGKLNMGEPQKKGNRTEMIYSRYEPSSGSWVSANYRPGGKNWKLSRFTFETAKAQTRGGSIKTSAYAKARYTSTIANLWENSTKPYSSKSPVVGRAGSEVVIPEGTSRRGLHYWSQVESVFTQTMPEALAKTERKIIEEFEKNAQN